MIIKIEKIINCSSQHANFPASNLLHNPPPGPWKCSKPGEMMATVTFELPEPSCIIGIDIGNYRSCVVLVDASTSADPDNWVPLVNHQFLTHEEAANNKFRDQVQLFTKKELNPETLRIKFDRVKVSCMQSANRKELFGLSLFTLRAEIVLDTGLNIFGRFKLKTDDTEQPKTDFKNKYLRLFPEKQKTYKEDLVEKIKETTVKNFNKRQEVERTPKKQPLLEKLEAGKSDEVFGKKVSGLSINSSPGASKNEVRTPFGDVVSVPDTKKITSKNNESSKTYSKLNNSIEDRNKAGPSRCNTSNGKIEIDHKQKKKNDKDSTIDDNDDEQAAVSSCKKCSDNKPCGEDDICKKCNKLLPPQPLKPPKAKKMKTSAKPKKLFSELLNDVKFSLSGYVNPQRDIIRKKASDMGAKYIANPDTGQNKCTHLICAFKNTPKSQLLEGHAKIITHNFIEDCHRKKKRFPWRRYSWSKSEKKKPESEDEIEASTSPVPPSNLYEKDTDPESDDTDY